MDEITLVPVSAAYADQLLEYRSAFPDSREQVTCDPDRIPGMDHLEDFGSIGEWLAYCESMQGKVSWYMTLRQADEAIVGCCVLRHSLDYDDDDPEFASHIGYSIHPDERCKRYGTQQLHLCLQKAKEAGLDRVRIICVDANEGSNRIIRANGGVYVDTLHGEESGLNVNRYDIILN